MKVNKDQAKEILKKLSPEELALYKQLNAEVGGLNEAGTRSVLRTIINNWKNYSTAMLMAIMMNSNMANAINRYSPDTYNAIKTEVSKDTVKGTPGQRVASSVTVSQTFSSGKADVDEKALQEKVAEIQKWIKDNNGRKFKLVITAGESQVTNQSGYGKKGSLAQFRADEVKRFLSRSVDAPIETKTKVGKTPYKKGQDDPQDPKYQAEQFITVDIVVDAESVCNFNPNQPGTQGTAANGYITFNDYISGEGTVDITPGQIPDRLTIVDANGNVKADTGYITTEKSKYSANWKYVPAYVLELTKVYLTKAKAVSGSKIKTIRVKDYEDLKAQLSTRPDASMIGDEIGPALAQLKKMVESGVKEFVIYDNMASGTVNFNESSGDLKAIVYSPVGSTGYQLKGNCN
jgi:hypothetical protein